MFSKPTLPSEKHMWEMSEPINTTPMERILAMSTETNTRLDETLAELKRINEALAVINDKFADLNEKL